MRINFDMSNTREYGSLTQTLPSGEYTVEIVNERESQMANGKGSRLTFEYHVTSGEYRGARVFDGLNLGHVDATSRGIAQSRLKAIASAVGLATIMDTQELYHKPFTIRLSVREWDGRQYNNVDEYRAVSTNVAVPSSELSERVEALSSSPIAPFWSVRQ